jgi:hypothetical protein
MLSSEALNSLFQLAAGSQGDTSSQGNQVGSSPIASQVRVTSSRCRLPPFFCIQLEQSPSRLPS